MMGYSTGQKLAFAGCVLGLVLTVGTACAPYWKTGEINLGHISSFALPINTPFLGNVKLVIVEFGLLVYCVEVDALFVEDQKCDTYNFDNAETRDIIMLVSVFVSAGLSLLCAIAACARSCCGSGGKTIFHGIILFLAGGCGITTVVLFSLISEESFGLKLIGVTYDWAFYVFIVGVVLTSLSALGLCFAHPDDTSGRVMSQPNQPINSIVASNTQPYPANQYPANPYHANPNHLPGQFQQSYAGAEGQFGQSQGFGHLTSDKGMVSPTPVP